MLRKLADNGRPLFRIIFRLRLLIFLLLLMMLLLLHGLRFLRLTMTCQLLLNSFFLGIDCDHSDGDLTLSILLIIIVLTYRLKTIIFVLAKYKFIVLPLIDWDHVPGHWRLLLYKELIIIALIIFRFSIFHMNAFKLDSVAQRLLLLPCWVRGNQPFVSDLLLLNEANLFQKLRVTTCTSDDFLRVLHGLA